MEGKTKKIENKGLLQSPELYEVALAYNCFLLFVESSICVVYYFSCVSLVHPGDHCVSTRTAASEGAKACNCRSPLVILLI